MRKRLTQLINGPEHHKDIVPIPGEHGFPKGFHFKGSEFVHHTPLHHFETAFFNLVYRQKFVLLVLAALLAASLFVNWHQTLIVLFFVLTAAYFLDLLFNAFVIFRSYAYYPELTFAREEIASLTADECPPYTIFCPLYREWQVVPQFVDAMQKLDYPREKLQIMFLLEENDQETIEKIRAYNLPSYFQIVVVPHSKPKTKPKAMNFGLHYATGEYLVIYDAEDVPQTDQLKKAVLAFRKVAQDVTCVQAKLNFYNPRQNLLTRLFTAEYSLWFDLVLPGFQSIAAPIPLGGTSNHFRISTLRELGGWDAFNVTEDCDLGMRLAKRGFRTAIIDSTTHEEANSDYLNWYNQRSRWIKGYIQTYFVHMRKPGQYFTEGKGKDLFLFQLIVGGKVLSLFINPVMWLITLAYFAFRLKIGGLIESFFPGPILYVGVFSFVVGNFLYLYYYMVGCAKRGEENLIKYVFLVPLYWLAMSAAAWKAVYEVIVKPHYWAKTVHGLHLSNTAMKDHEAVLASNAVTATVVEVPIERIVTPVASAMEPVVIESAPVDFHTELPPPLEEVPAAAAGEFAEVSVPDIDAVSEVQEEMQDVAEPELMQLLGDEGEAKKLTLFGKAKKFVFSGAGFLIMSALVANALNFGFNAYLGHVLNLEDFGIITTMSTFVYLLNLFVSSLSSTITHSVSYLEGKYPGLGNRFFKRTWLPVALSSIIGAAAWIAGVGIVGRYLHIDNTLVVASFAPAILFGTLSAFNGGYLQGTFNFGVYASLLILEAVSKLGLAIFFFTTGYSNFVALALPGSLCIMWICSTVFVAYVYRSAPKVKVDVEETRKFPLAFYAASFMRGLSAAIFLSIDVLLAKHYLTAHDAGVYSLLSLVGKMIYFFGALFNVFIVAVVSRTEGEGKNPEKEFSRIFIATTSLTLLAGVGLSITGPVIVPFLLGEEARAILPYVPLYAGAICLFTIATTIVLYRLARKQYIFPLLSFVMSVLWFVAIGKTHGSVGEFVTVIALINFLYFVAVVVLDVCYSWFKYTYRNIRDALLVFAPLPDASFPAAGKKRILIFNWRDIESKFAGGAEVYIHELAKRWVADGHSVTLFTSNDGTQTLNGNIDGVRVIRRGGFFGVYALAALYYCIRLRGEFDSIIDCENGIPFFSPLYAGEPVYCLLHHVHQEVFRLALAAPFASLASLLEKRLMPLVYRNCSFITVSESSKQNMQAIGMGGREIHVVHPGVALDFLAPGKKSDVPCIAYVGRLREYKSVDVLIDAFVHIVEVMPDAHLHIAGSGDDKERLKALVEHYNLGTSVTFEGRISEVRKLELMQEAWVMVNPSFIEGWGITTIEANACGTPVVASDVPGLRDSVRHFETGILVPYGDAKVLGDAILQVLRDRDLRNTMQKNALAWASHFSWENSCRRFISIISREMRIPSTNIFSVNRA